MRLWTIGSSERESCVKKSSLSGAGPFVNPFDIGKGTWQMKKVQCSTLEVVSRPYFTFRVRITFYLYPCARASAENFPGGGGSNGKKDRKIAK